MMHSKTDWPTLRTGSAAPRSTRLLATLEGISLWLAVLLFLAIQPLYVDASEDTRGTGTLRYLDSQGQSAAPATILTTDYHVIVSGLIADTHLKQSFENTRQQTIALDQPAPGAGLHHRY